MIMNAFIRTYLSLSFRDFYFYLFFELFIDFDCNLDMDLRNSSIFDEDTDIDDNEYEEFDDIDMDAEDDMIESCHETDSEQETDHDDEEPDNITSVYEGKDGTKWSKESFSLRGRKGLQDILKEKPGPKGLATNVSSAKDAFEVFFTDDIIHIITENTNKFILTVRSNFERERDARETNISEIKAFIGLLILSGVKKANHLNFKEMWSNDGMGLEIFTATMTYNRFNFLIRCLRFDDLQTRDERKTFDKMAHIRDFWTSFTNNCKERYRPSELLTIDEKLEPFRGRCSFKQYIPNKPAKYGMKIFAIVDAKSFYTLNMELYVGQQPEGPFKKNNSPQDIVLRLIGTYFNTGRNLTTDNWYTSFPLSKILLDHKITMVGTLRKNKSEIPNQFLPNKFRPEKTSLFGFTKTTTIVSYVPKKGKSVILLSTHHHNNSIDPSSEDDLKPEIITFYNSTKGGVDTVDQMCGTYSVARRTRRWPMVVFFACLNVAGINSMIIFMSKGYNVTSRREFLKNLGLSLLIDHLKIRSQQDHLPRTLKSLIMKYVDVQTDDTQDVSSQAARRSRCSFCPRQKDRKVRARCSQCKRPVCIDHSKFLCHECNVLE